MIRIGLMDLGRQHAEHAKEYEDAVLDVLRSGHYILGDYVQKFEEAFAAYIGTKYAVSVGNGTDALYIALKALGIGKGDEVITTPYTFFATAEAISLTGAIPVFADINPETYCIDANQIEYRITKRTKAILPVHLYGYPAEMKDILDIAARNHLFVIEDCAQSAGCTYEGKKTGSLGDIGCFSFFPTKNLGCAGDGGIITTDNSALADIVRSLRSHGSGKNGEKVYHLLNPEEDDNKLTMVAGMEKYYNFLIGQNSRLDALQAALLSTKLNYLDDFVMRRRIHADNYTQELKNASLFLPTETSGKLHTYYLYVIRHAQASVIRKQLEKKGIETGCYYPVPLHVQTAFRFLGYHYGDFPNAESVAGHVFSIPVYPELKTEERNYIIEQLLSLMANL